MGIIRWKPDVQSSTRGQIVALLRRNALTVDELARALELTGNAVRSHLATLERDGLVDHRRRRRGVGKPANVYDLTDEAEHLFAKAYAPVLDELLGVLTDQLGTESVQETLREVGRRLAGSLPGERSIEARLDEAADTLNRLGGLTESEIDGDAAIIRGYSCPLTSISANHCSICQLAEALVTEIVGLPMQERCERGPRPRCRFEGRIT